MVAIATQIALENITAAHYALRVASRLIDTLDDSDPEKMDIIRKVCDRLCNQHNTPYLEVWLQNITYTQDKKRKKSPYTMRLCQLVVGISNEPLWNNDWLKNDLIQNLPYDSVVNKETLKKVTPVSTFRESRAYNEQNYY